MIFFKLYSNKFNRISFFLFLLIFIFILTQIGNYAQEEFISIDEISPGMQGIGKTVFSGTKVEEFDVHVIDVIPETNISNPYILVRLSGDKIDENGGISAGMSGSPVYFDGKLAGAVSHAWEMSEHNLCLITPIDRMIPLLDYAIEDSQDIYSRSCINNSQVISIPLDTDLQKKLSENIYTFEKYDMAKLNSEDQKIYFQSIQSPILISGFEGRACKLLEKNLLERGASSIKRISGYQDINKELPIGKEINEIHSGSAIGVQLSTGDASLLTIGTATYCKDSLVLAFGHPFMHQGDVSYLFSAVYIYHSFPSIVMPFKVGSPYLLLGEVLQDRDAGILAKLNHFPRIVSCKISVYDLDQKIKIQSGAKIIPQSDILQSVVSSLLIQSVDRTIDRIGQGTAVVHLDIKDSKSGKSITQENIFFSKDDIAMQCSKDFEELFDLLVNNYNEHIELSEIQVDITIREQNQSAVIKEVKLGEKEYYPGDTIEAQLIIKPFRKPDEVKVAKIKLPDYIQPSEAILIIKGGATQEVISEKTIPSNEEDYLLDGWYEIQEHMNKREKNNQIVLELIFLNEQEKLTTPIQEDENVDKIEIKEILNTDFVVEGYHEMYLNINNMEDQNKVNYNE